MRRFYAGLALALCLAGCATAPSPQLVATKGAYGFELAYSTAKDLYNANLLQLATHGKKDQAQKLMVSLLDCRPTLTGGRCTGYVQLARDAADAGSATDVATQTAAIQAVVDQVAALVAASK